MDSLGSLNAFVQAAEARSFTVAGRQLGVSSSAIGKAVARMEERLGVRLFHRSTRSVTLTAEGTLFLERCRRIFSEIEAAELELSQTHEAQRGILRVSLPLAGMLMMPTLVAFMRAYPEIVLDLDFSDRVAEGLTLVEAGIQQSEGGWLTPKLLRVKGELLLAQRSTGAPETAEDLFRQALDGARRQETLSWELRATTSLTRLLRDQDRSADALACLRPVYDRFTEGFGTADLITAKQLLGELGDAGGR